MIGSRLEWEIGSMAVQEIAPENLSSDSGEERLAASRALVADFLRENGVAERAAAVMAQDDEISDEIVERAKAGEYAADAFVEGYGEEFVQELKARHGG